MGNLINLMSIFKGLPLAYSKDLQEDKEPIFDSSKTIKQCLINLAGMLETSKINKIEMFKALNKGYPTATDLADYLVTNLNFTFRDAHEITGKIVLLAEKKECSLEELTIDELKKIDNKIDSKALNVLSINSSISKKNSFGGTSPRLVKKAITSCLVSFSISKTLSTENFDFFFI